MALVLQDLLDHLVTHAQTSGYFDTVNQHEPKSAPGHGINCSIWLDHIKPARSGQSKVSVTVIFNVRLFSNMLADPQDQQDPNLSNAAAAFWSNLAGDCTLDGTTRCVDLFGMEGDALELDAGYVAQDKGHYRVYTIKVPIIVNDVFDITP